MRTANRGFSLVEMSVVLVLMAVLAVLVVTSLPLFKQAASGDIHNRKMESAQQALLGHARSRHHLPAADSDGDGKADSGQMDGWLPVSDLGLPAGMRLRYVVDPELTTPPDDLYQPLIPPSGSLVWVRHDQTPVNGLDLCQQLLTSHNQLPGMEVPAAYALAVTNEASASIHLPGSSASHLPRYASGYGELAAQLGCIERLGRAQGAVQAALAADSADRMNSLNQQFRDFDRRVADLVMTQAEAGHAFAGVDMAMATADEAIAILLTVAGWPPEGVAIAVGVAEHANATWSIAIAIKQLLIALDDIQAAEEGIANADVEKSIAIAQRAQASGLLEKSRKRALDLDKGGVER